MVDEHHVVKREAKNIRAGNGGKNIACHLSVQALLGPWIEEGGGRLFPGEEKVPVTEPVEKDVKVPVQVGGKEVNVVPCSH